jgi:hypothetical protein
MINDMNEVSKVNCTIYCVFLDIFCNCICFNQAYLMILQFLDYFIAYLVINTIFIVIVLKFFLMTTYILNSLFKTEYFYSRYFEA